MLIHLTKEKRLPVSKYSKTTLFKSNESYNQLIRQSSQQQHQNMRTLQQPSAGTTS